jgi:tRNA A-37 threonylcarbamoyl transferase component Bud32
VQQLEAEAYVPFCYVRGKTGEGSLALKLIEPIDKGGFGNVDKVEDEGGQLVARKTFSKNQPMNDELLENVKKRFAKEVRVQGAIDHPNIVKIVGHDLKSDPPYYLMPLAESSLSKDLKADRQLGGSFIAAISDVVAALEEMHSMQIFHRDLKPQNVLRYSDKGQSYYAVSDFGLISIKDTQLSALTSTGMARQSDYYTAPEITKDLRYASAQSDIYSLGCILHDMVGTEDRVPCGEIREPGDYAPILLGCTRRDPRQRFKSAKAVLDAILSVTSSGSVPPSQKAIDFVAMLDASAPPEDGVWERFADFIEQEASDAEKKAVFQKLGSERIDDLANRDPHSASRVGVTFANWVADGSFVFDYCDALANRLDEFIERCDFETKVACLMALLRMGTSHNRWYVERMFVGHCTAQMDSNLAKRLAVQFHIEGPGICRSISHLEDSITFDRAQLHPAVLKAVSEVCP